MVAWLVAVNILTDEARDIGRYILTLHLRIGCKELVETLERNLATTHILLQKGEVVWHKPQILPSVTLAIFVSDTRCVVWVEVGTPLACR